MRILLIYIVDEVISQCSRRYDEIWRKVGSLSPYINNGLPASLMVLLIFSRFDLSWSSASRGITNDPLLTCVMLSSTWYALSSRAACYAEGSSMT